MTRQNKHDVVVVGAGFAGLVAAVRLTEAGLKVALLEKGAGAAYPCNSRYSGGIFHIAFESPELPAPKLRELIDNTTYGGADPVLAEAMAINAGRTINWLKTRGARFIQVGKLGCVLAPPRPHTAGLIWEGRGPDVMLKQLCSRLVELGGTLALETRVENLLTDGKKCIGVDAWCGTTRQCFDATAVVLADGGFQADHTLLQQHIAPAPESVKQRGAANGTGDGLRMAQAIGADITALQGFYGHVLARNAMHDDRLWPYPELDLLASAGIVVGAEGQRVLDEGGRGVYIANVIAGLADPLSTTIIFDSAIWEGPGREARIPPNPQLELAGGTIHRASTIDALAEAAGLPAATLRLTLDTYNRACERNTTGLLLPARSTDLGAAWPIKVPPFFAVPVCAGITFTMGGIRIDSNARVLDKAGQPIAGLYAAGSATGGVDGGPRYRYVGGLARAAIFGMQAADHISSHITASN